MVRLQVPVSHSTNPGGTCFGSHSDVPIAPPPVAGPGPDGEEDYRGVDLPGAGKEKRRRPGRGKGRTSHDSSRYKCAPVLVVEFIKFIFLTSHTKKEIVFISAPTNCVGEGLNSRLVGRRCVNSYVKMWVCESGTLGHICTEIFCKQRD